MKRSNRQLILTLALIGAVVSATARHPDQFEPRRTGPFTPEEEALLEHVKGKVCQRERPNDILVSKPDFVVFVPDQSIFRDRIDLKKPSDNYNDHFQVIYDERRQLLYAFWTQASKEAGPDQHISFSKSADKGRTWTKPIILAGGEYKILPCLAASWQQPMLSKSGRLYCLWNQQVTSVGPHCGNMFGMCSDDAGETWNPVKEVKFGFRSDMDPKDPTEPPCWCNWQRPLRLGENGKYFVGCSRDGQAPGDAHRCTRVDFWQFENIDDDPPVEDIRVTCLNPGKAALGVEDIDEPNLTLFGIGNPAVGQTVAEAAPVKLPDGRLFVLCRSSTGYPLWTTSEDGGRTWARLKALRDRHGKPFLHPCSPGPLYDWKGCAAGSGFYFALIHNTFDFTEKEAYQTRGPLYLLAGCFDPKAEQPIQFDEPQLFTPREAGNSFYASYTVVDGTGILWYNDMKYFLLGRRIGPEWFRRVTPVAAEAEYGEDIGWCVTLADGRTIRSNRRSFRSADVEVRIVRENRKGAIDYRGCVTSKGTNVVRRFEFPSRLEFAAAEVARFVMPQPGRECPGIALTPAWFVPSEDDPAVYRSVERGHGPKGWMHLKLPPVGKRKGVRALERVALPETAKGELWLLRGTDRDTDAKARGEIRALAERVAAGGHRRMAVLGGSGTSCPLARPADFGRCIFQGKVLTAGDVTLLENPKQIAEALEKGTVDLVVNPFGEGIPVASVEDYLSSLDRIRTWIDRGGIWIEAGGGYPFYRAMVPSPERAITVPYPTANADYMRLERRDGHSFSAYGVQPRPPHEPWKAPAPFVPAVLSVGTDGKKGWLSHAFVLSVRPGEAYTTPVYRLTRENSLEKDLENYALANDLTRKLSDKISAGKLAAMRLAPLVAVWGKYADLRAVVEKLPSPTIVRLYTYLHGGFDKQYPDHLPPNEQNFGTAAEFRELIDFIRQKGHLSTPYTNPTFWCDEPRGPTFVAAGDGALAIGPDGKPYRESYGKPWGWTTTLWHPAVRAANRRTREAFRTDYPVDILFEDQTGEREHRYDFNPASPSPIHYVEGLLSLAEEDASVMPIGTEDGWDKMLNIHLIDEGMDWGLYQSETKHPERTLFRAKLARKFWTLEPLTQRLFHHRTVMKHHDSGQFVVDARSLAWTLALGYHLNAQSLAGDSDLRRFARDAAARADLERVARLQREVASNYFGRRLTRFVHRRPPPADEADDGWVEATYDGNVKLTVNLSPHARGGLGPWGWRMELPDGRMLSAPSPEKTIMSYNICHGKGMDGRLDLKRTAAVILAEKPDFVGLQELDTAAERSRFVDEPSELARLTGMHATFAKAIPFEKGDYGNALLSREAPLDVVRLPLPGAEPRVLLLCEFSDCVVGTMHLAVDSEKARAESIDLVRGAVARFAGKKPVFLTGDWNSLPDSVVLKGLGAFLTVLSDQRCQTYHGSIVCGPDKRPLDMTRFCIDYIAVDSGHARDWKVSAARVVEDRVTSDHAPIVVRIASGR